MSKLLQSVTVAFLIALGVTAAPMENDRRAFMPYQNFPQPYTAGSPAFDSSVINIGDVSVNIKREVDESAPKEPNRAYGNGVGYHGWKRDGKDDGTDIAIDANVYTDPDLHVKVDACLAGSC